MKKKIAILVVLVLIAAAAYYFIDSSRKAKEAAANAFTTQPLERGRFSASVGATGIVEANQSTVMTWLTPGRIEAIDVVLGQRVQTGDRLAELDLKTVPQNIIMAQAELVAARRDLANLQDSEVGKAQAQLNLSQARDALEQAEKDSTSLDYQRASDATLDSARASYIIAQDRVEQLEELYSGMAHLAEDDPTRASMLAQLSAARQERDRTLANLNWLLGKPDANEIAGINAKLDLARARVADAEREWERLKNGVDPDDLKAAQARVDSIEATIDMLYLDAPFGGIVTAVQNKVGDQVSAGTPSFRIDDLSKLIIDVDISEVDINLLKVGDTVTVTFDAIIGQEYHGHVTQVGRVGQTGKDGLVYFAVELELDDADERVLPGMTAAVVVTVKEVENALLIPNQAVRIRDGSRVVFVLQDQLPVLKKVTIGLTSDTHSELLSGEVREGDLIILNPPAENAFMNMFSR